MTAPTDDTTGTLTRTEAETSTEIAARPAPAADAPSTREALASICHGASLGIEADALAEIARKALDAAPAADASLEARAEATIAAVADINVTLTGTACAIERFWLAVVRAVDASRPAAPEVDAEDLWADYRTERPHMTIADRVAFLAGVEAGRRTSDASRPGLTEEQAQIARAEPVIAAWLDYFAAMDRQHKSGTAADARTVRELRAKVEAMSPSVTDIVYFVALARHRARGEVGPAATGLTRAMHAAQQRPSVPARIEYEHGPDGETYRVEDDWQPCACGAAVSRGEAHSTGPGHDVDWSAVDRQRATLHARDPAAPDPRVDYSDGMRPAVTGGECAKCLHAPPLHERTCPTLARRPR